MSFFAELKRRNVFRVGIAYALMGWVVLQGADFALDLIDAPNWVIQTLSIIVVIGLPFALFFAWAFEMTPEGIKKESEVDRDESITSKTGHKLDRAIKAVLILAVAYLLVDKLFLQERNAPMEEPMAAAETSDASVAVLPFANMSDDKQNEYFSDGLTDTLLHMLAQLPDLRVAARTSSFAFKGQNKDIGEIAEALGVANILEGSVQRANNQVRVTAQLIRADDGFHVWSQNYTRPMEDIFAIQDEIASDVASALGASLLEDGTMAIQGLDTENLDAYDFYLRGLDHQVIFTYSSLDVAENDFQQALLLDPEFSDARMSLVRNYFLKRTTGMLNDEELQRLAKPLIDQIMSEDPDNQQIPLYERMLTVRYTSANRTLEEVRTAIYEQRTQLARVPTDSFMRVEIASALAFAVDEPESGLDLLETGLLIDPLEPELYLEKGRILMDQDRLEEAEIAFLRGVELNPDNPTGYARMSSLSRKRGDYAGLIEWRHEGIERDPQDHELTAAMANELIDIGLSEEAERWIAATKALAPGSGLSRSLAIRNARERGESDIALELSWKAIEDRIDVRRGAHYTAVFTFTNLMMDAGRSREGYEQIVAFEPTAADFAIIPGDARIRDLQFGALFLHLGFAEEEQRFEAWQTFTQALDDSGWPWREPGNRLPILDSLMANDLQKAVDDFVEHRLDGAFATRPNNHRRYLNFLLSPVYDDPKVQAAIAQAERDRDQARKEVESMLLTAEWSNP